MPFSSAPAAITARTGKIVIDISTLNDSSHSVAVLAAGSIRMVGLTSDGDSADYATVQLTATGQLDFNYSQDGISRLPAGIAPGESNDLTAQAYGNILASRIVYDSGSYNLSILSVSGNPNDRPYELAAVAIDAEDSPPSHTSVQALANGTLLASARSDTTLSLVHFSVTACWITPLATTASRLSHCPRACASMAIRHSPCRRTASCCWRATAIPRQARTSA